MTNEELQYSAKYILNWATASYCRKLEELITARSKESGRVEAEKEWLKANSDGGIGCFDRNPFHYGKDYNQKTIDRLQDELEGWSNIKEFVIERICKQIN